MSECDYYHVYRLEGYVDGKESWNRMSSQWGRDAAKKEMEKLQSQSPNRKFRVRKAPKRK